MVEIKGTLKRTKGIIVSDPGYTNDVNCKYTKTGLSNLKLYVQGFIESYMVDFTDSKTPDSMRAALSSCPMTRLDLVIYQEPKTALPVLSVLYDHVAGGYLRRRKSLRKKRDVEIGVDTAHIYIGNDRQFSKEASLALGGDGYLGDITEFDFSNIDKQEFGIKNKFAGIYVALTFDGDLISEKDLEQYIRSTFEIA